MEQLQTTPERTTSLTQLEMPETTEDLLRFIQIVESSPGYYQYSTGLLKSNPGKHEEIKDRLSKLRVILGLLKPQEALASTPAGKEALALAKKVLNLFRTKGSLGKAADGVNSLLARSGEKLRGKAALE
jgi:hypothetical protein